MQYALSIVPKGGFFKKKPSFSLLRRQFGAAFRMGGIGVFFGLETAPTVPQGEWEAAYLLHGKATPPSRGFALYIKKGFAAYEVACHLPATRDDLQDMFSFAGALAAFLGPARLQDSAGRAASAGTLATLYPGALQNSCETLKSLAIGAPGFFVSGVRYPLRLPEALCRRIAGVPAENGERFFAAWLSEGQALDYAYWKPRFSAGEDGALQATYTLRENTTSIIPQRPFIPYGPHPPLARPPAAWHVAVASAKLGCLATLPFDVFRARLADADCKPFDDDHVILRALPLRRLQEIAAPG